jgi:hypothetical protein
MKRSPPIKASVLRSTATVKVCNGTDIYQNQTYTEYTVQRVYVQPTEEIVKTMDNTDQRLKSILFVDARRSSPALDWHALFQSAHDKGGDVRVVIRDVTYTVASVDGLRDGTDTLHHWEIGLV